MKYLRLLVFLAGILVFSTVFASDDERWGSQNSFVQSTVVGSNSSFSNKSVGLDPAGCFGYTYSTVQMAAVEQGERDGIALAVLDSGTSLTMDLAQCEDLYFPLAGDTMVFMIAKSEIDEFSVYHGYYGCALYVKDAVAHSGVEDPEIAPDIRLYRIPAPSATTDGESNTITWELPEIQEDSLGNPIAGYNIFYTDEVGNVPSKINLSMIPYGNNFYNESFRVGYYAISLIMKNGAQTMEILPGPDGEPGLAGFDDNNNTFTDESAEFGFGDDIYKIVRSKYSNLCNDAGQIPPAVADLAIINSDSRIYLTWSKSAWENIARYDILKNGTFYKSVQHPLYCDDTATLGDEYEIKAVTSDGIMSPPGNTVDAAPFDGELEDLDFSSQEAVLFPAWSKAPLPAFGEHCIAYAGNSATASNTYALFMADMSGNTWKLFDSLPVFWASSICWGDGDSQIYFTLIDEGHAKIASQEADTANTNSYTLITPGWGNWTDPDWADSLNQYTAVPMLAFSVDYDIWACDPAHPNLSTGEGLFALTDFSGADSTYGTTHTCFQPKWSPDNTEVAFIIRSPGPAGTVVYSDIYIINNVQTLIQDIEGGGNPISSTIHPFMERVTFSNYPLRDRPIWCPSWSNDSTMISYCVDTNNSFNNYEFASDPGLVINILTGADFDAWVWERGIGGWPVGYPEMNSVTASEGFVSWAPAGGDKFVSAVIDFSFGRSQLRQFIDPSIKGETGGGSKMAIDTSSLNYVSFTDRDMTSLILSQELYDAHGSAGIFPIEREIENTVTGKTNIGASRRILVGGEGRTAEEFQIKMHYTRFQASGFAEYTLQPYRWSGSSWAPVDNYKIIPDEDGDSLNDYEDGGFVTINTDLPGYYTVLKDGDCPHGDSPYGEGTDLENIISAPNPSRNGEIVYFLNIPKETTIKVYNLGGELIASSKNNNSLSWVIDHWEWVVKNDELKEISSGIYLVTFDYNGRTARKKVAIIK
ncbi:T9SS type A sorting domain-containing protein [bacterium]|nr:T9SS type A sorting domain-containing protein [bacterium]